MKVALILPSRSKESPHPSSALDPWVDVGTALAEGLAGAGVGVDVFPARERTTEGQGPDMLEIARGFERTDFSVIHNHYGAAALTFSRLVQTPVITTIFRRPSPEELAIYREYDRSSDYVAPSENGACKELHYCAKIPPGVDTSAHPFQSRPGPYLVFADQTNPQGGAADAIEIAHRAGRRLVLMDPTGGPAEFQNDVAPGARSGLLDYRKPRSSSERKDLLAGAHALLLTRPFFNPFPLFALEAMAGGTPVIFLGERAKAGPVTPGVTGFIVESLEEAVAALEDGVPSIDRAGCRARAEEEFSPERMVSEYLLLYERVIAREARFDRRPWGYYEILNDRPGHKVKRISIESGKRLSLQRHRHRSEHWVILDGEATVTREAALIDLGPGDSIDIPAGAAHRIANVGAEPLTFIEVQQGDYFGEDDIERLEDDFGRS